MIKATLDAARGSLDTSNRFSLFSSSIVFSRSSSDHFHIPVTLRGVHRTKDIVAMVDSGATATFIHRKFVEGRRRWAWLPVRGQVLLPVNRQDAEPVTAKRWTLTRRVRYMSKSTRQ